MYFGPKAQPRVGSTLPPVTLPTKSCSPVLLRTQFDFAAKSWTPSSTLHWTWSAFSASPHATIAADNADACGAQSPGMPVVINVLPYMTRHSTFPCSGVVVAVVVAVVVVVGVVVWVVVVGVVVKDDVTVVDVVWLVVGDVRTEHESNASSSYAVTISLMVATVTEHSSGSFKNSNVLHEMWPSVPSGPRKRRTAWFSTSTVPAHLSPLMRKNDTPLLMSHSTAAMTPSCGTRGSTPASSKQLPIMPLSARACPMQLAFASIVTKSFSAVLWQTKMPLTAVVVNVVVAVEVSVAVAVEVPVEVGE